MIDNIYELEELLDESSALSKATLGLRINGIDALTGKGVYNVLKEHGNKKFLAYVQKSKDIDELRYLRRDTMQSVAFFDKLVERIQKSEKLGECEETKKYYKGIKKMYLDKGITSKDVIATRSFTKQQILPAITKRIEELSKK